MLTIPIPLSSYPPRLVDELLDVARVTAGKVSLNQRALDLGEVATAAVRALQDGSRGRDHRVTLRTEPVTVHADPTRFEQIVTNLVDNAMKYTPARGSIDIAVTREGEQAVLRVKDTGRGIAPEALPRVFELFAQGDQPLDRALGGLGIGLALSRRLVELQGGTIEAHSEGPGRGAEFVVRLPGATPGTPAMATPAPSAPARRRILVVEDNDDSRESLRLLLESLGHDVVAAADGPQGLALALERPLDVILVDLGLPGLDGFELARAVRGSARASTVRLIALTGYGQAEDRRRSAESGFDAHLVKPVSAATLLGVLG